MGFFDWIKRGFKKPNTPWINQDEFVEHLEEEKEDTQNTTNMTEQLITDGMPDQSKPLEGMELINKFLDNISIFSSILGSKNSSLIYFGYTGNLSRSLNPNSSVKIFSSSNSGHGASGLT